LLEWREGVARRLDRPPFKVIGDDKLLDIARAKPVNHEGLVAAGVAPRRASQWGSKLLEAVARGLKKPEYHRARKSMPSSSYLQRLEKLKHWRRDAAAQLGVESDVVLPRGLLLRLASGGSEEVDAILEPSPWRRRRFGAQISAVLHSIAA